MEKKDVKKYLKRSDIQIEGNVATWNINAVGAINGTYIGSFRFKCYLTPSEKLAAGRDYRELLGPESRLAFTNEDNLAFSLTQLKYRVISSPPFWSSAIGGNGNIVLQGDLPDEPIIDMVLDAAVASELKFLAQLQKKKEETIKQAKDIAEKILDHKEGKEVDEDEEDDEVS